MKKRKSIRRKYMLGILLLAVAIMLIPNVLATTSPNVITDLATGVQPTNSTLWGNLTRHGSPYPEETQAYFKYKTYTGGSWSSTTPFLPQNVQWYNQTLQGNPDLIFNSTQKRFAVRNISYSGEPNYVQLRLMKVFSPTGSLYVRLRYTSNDTVIMSAAAFDVSILSSTAYSDVTFVFQSTINLYSKSIYITVEYNATMPNTVLVRHDAAGIGGNTLWIYNGTNWNSKPNDGLRIKFKSYTNYYPYSANITLLTPGTYYQYYAYAYNLETLLTSTGATRLFLSKPRPLTNAQSPTATTTNITLTWTNGEGEDGAYIEYTTTTPPSPWNIGGGTKINATGYITGTTYIHTVAGTGRYYYKLWSYAFDSGVYSTGGVQAPFGDTPMNITAIKAPEAPTNTHILLINSTTVNLTWTKGTNANNTVIVKKINSPPASITDGTIIYNSTGTYTHQILNSSAAIYYRAWSYRYFTSPSASRYSTNSTYFNASGLYVTVQDEENCTNLTYDILIKNKDGTQTYSQKGVTGTLIVNVSQCPTGDDVSIIISSPGYRYRQFYINLVPPVFFFYLPVYLPSNASSDLYLLQVFARQNEYFNSPPIHNALVTVRSYINCTDAYYSVSNTYTDANGQTEVYLIRNKLHIILIHKDYYTNITEDYTPDSSYRQRIFRMYYEQTSITPQDTIFTNINWSIEPSSTIHYGSYKIYFNITSSDNKLEWFYMKVHYYNQTTNTWTLLYSNNLSTASGGSISFTIPDATGKYSIDCVFKKQGYPEYELSQTGSLIQFIQHLNQAFIGIPDMAYFVGLIIIMMVIMGFFMLYIGSGILTGYVGLGIFFMGLLMKPLTIPIGGTDTVSGWVIFAITFLAYTMGSFLWSRL